MPKHFSCSNFGGAAGPDCAKEASGSEKAATIADATIRCILFIPVSPCEQRR
jgi:hypothetical protein